MPQEIIEHTLSESDRLWLAVRMPSDREKKSLGAWGLVSRRGVWPLVPEQATAENLWKNSNRPPLDTITAQPSLSTYPDCENHAASD
jgi:hypothetical protein